MFWEDLSAVGLINGSFTTATPNNAGASVPQSGVSLYLPEAKLGGGNYIFVWSGGWSSTTAAGSDGINYFGLTRVTGFPWPAGGISSTSGLTVSQADNIDKKLDDGNPMYGTVLALGVPNGPAWAGTLTSGPPFTTATPGSSTTCFDNGNAAGVLQQYSVEVSGGNNVNCALSFRFQ